MRHSILKYFFLLFLASTCLAQVPPKPAPALPPKLTELQNLRIQLALKNMEVTEIRLQVAQQANEAQKSAAYALVEAVRKELNLDDTWVFDIRQDTFVKNPTPVVPATAVPPPTPKK